MDTVMDTVMDTTLKVNLYYFNPLQPAVAYLYPLKISENLKFFGCFQRGHR